MSPLHALAIIGALAAGTALAQGGAAIGTDTPDQAVERQLMAQIQQSLKQDGYYQGQVDGFYGDQTRQALAQWQHDQGIRATGQLNAETLAAMDVAPGAQRAETPGASPESRETPRRD